jgi:uncharacterized membrane protein
MTLVAGFTYFFREPIFSFALILVGVAITLVFFARSKDDDDKNIRANIELLKLYAKLTYLIFYIVGALVLLYVISKFILEPIFKVGGSVL